MSGPDDSNGSDDPGGPERVCDDPGGPERTRDDPGDQGDPASRDGLAASVTHLLDARDLSRGFSLLRRYVAVSAGVFAVGALLGYLLIDPSMVDSPSDGVVIVDEESTKAYFLNNASVAVAMMGGMGVLTLLLLLHNGFILGAAVKAALIGGVHPSEVAARILPHGSIELPAAIVAGAIGLFLPWRLVQTLRGNRELIVTPGEQRHLARLFVVVAVALLVAAWVEANLTGDVAALVRQLLGGWIHG